MNTALKFCINHSDAISLAAHLSCCDAAFVPPLSKRVDIKTYAKKLTEKSLLFEAWHEDLLVGTIAIYCNNIQNHTAFITNVSVLPSWQSQKIATYLMNKCLDYFTTKEFRIIELEVDHRNDAAIAFYEKFGFLTTSKIDTSSIMQFNIKN